MGNSGRGDWVLMFGILVVGMMMFVGAVSWNAGASSVNYTAAEDTIFYHNLSVNVSAVDSDISFAIDTDTFINWTNSSGTYSVNVSAVASWIFITNSFNGNFTINATNNNQTGFFIIPVQVINATGDDVTTDFEFIINATNDAPNFTSSGIISNYTYLSNEVLQSYTLEASDEENHFPLSYNVRFISDNCTHGAGTGYSDNADCNLSAFGLNVSFLTNTTANMTFTPNASYVGTYWANISVIDAATNYVCPHSWCDATYNTTNATTYYSQLVRFTISPSLVIDDSNCTGATLMEGEQFNCTVVVTTPGETDSLTIGSNASFRVGSTPGNYNSSWFNPGNSSPVGSNFNYNISFSVTPTKVNVGNLSVNLSVLDINSEVNGSVAMNIYVNFTEFNVTMNSISDVVAYENKSFNVVATDRDLLILDSSVKDEVLTFASNTSWVTFSDSTPMPISGDNYTTATVNINYDYALATYGVMNHSVLINVTDNASNSASRIFIIGVMNGSAPEWNPTLSDPVNLNLTEDVDFSYNVSMNVSDVDGDPINFSYVNVSGEFCSLNSSNFNQSSGVISFTPMDCDVGYHNVTITATDGNLNSSKQFNFTVNNVDDAPGINSFSADNGTFQTITPGFSLRAAEATAITFTLIVEDNDFLIPSGQKSFYNESLIVNVTTTNSSGGVVNLFNFSFTGMNGVNDAWAEYNASFTPTGLQVGNYTVFLNIADSNGNNTNRTFYLNISEVLDNPLIDSIANRSLTIYDSFNLTVNATDDEDDRGGLNLSFNIYNLTVGAPNLTIGNETGIIGFDMGSNNSYSGKWEYNVSVTDSDSQVNFTTFWLIVYGTSNLITPSSGSTFNLTENVAGILNFTINHSVRDVLTYEFWIDPMTCVFQNNSNCSYGNFSLREIVSSHGNGTVHNWSFTPNYTDETYGNLKNITVSVYPNTTAINSSQRAAVATNFSFKLNISHTNSPVSFICNYIVDSSTTWLQELDYDLSDCFSDFDATDSFYLQDVNFSILSNASSSDVYANSVKIPTNISFNQWQLTFGTNNRVTAVSEKIILGASDIDNETNLTMTSAIAANNFTVSFTEPETTPTPQPTPTGGGSSSGSTRLKHYSLKIITPGDVVISEKNYIDVPFSVQNNGQVDLEGINLSSFIKFNDEFSDAVTISLQDSYLRELRYGQSENYSMRIIANTQKSGKFKATLLANVSSPKFSDWADFFIELRKTNESEAEQILLFTEKFLSDNPSCLELTELVKEARKAFESGEFSTSLDLATRATEACEEAISANEQIKYPVVGFVRDNFYYISFATLAIFLFGFILYIYKRIRFNKYGVDEYV